MLQPKRKTNKKQSNPAVNKKLTVGDHLSDVYTNVANMVSTGGMSAIGDAISGISPKAAKAVEKYTFGMIPRTKQSQRDANRSSNPNYIKNRISSSADALNGAALEVLTAGAANNVGPTIKKGTKLIKEAVSKKIIKPSSKIASKPYNLVSSDDILTKDITSASDESIRRMREPSVYKDIANAKTNKVESINKDIQEGEARKYSSKDIEKATNKANKAKHNANIYKEVVNNVTLGEFVNPNIASKNNVFYRGQQMGKKDLKDFVDIKDDAAHIIDGTSTKNTTYISHNDDYKFDRSLKTYEDTRKVMQQEAGDNISKMFNKNYKPDVKSINMNKNGGTIKPVKKAFYGAAISAGVGMVTTIMAQEKARKDAIKAKSLADTNNFDSAMQEQSIYANQFKDDNINDLPVYAKGGKVKTNNTSTTGKYDTVGGDLLPISDNAEVVEGNTHKENKIDGSYGVTLSEQGEPVANVEDKEVVVDNELVFSDKLKKGTRTFADIALDVNSKIGELQTKSKGIIKPAEKFSTERTIQGLQLINEKLFQEQELVKSNTVGTEEETVDVVDGVVPVGRNGMNINEPDFSSSVTASADDIGVRKDSFGEDFAPLIADNITNLLLTANAPKVVKPIVKRAPILDTRVNSNPQLANVANAVASSNDAIRGNTNNSAVARANITATNLKGLEANNSIYANDQAQERQLRNQQLVATTAVQNDNNDATMDYQNEVRDATLQKNASYSKNITNLTEDIKAGKQNELQKDSDDSLIMLGLLDDPTGEKGRTFGRLGRNLSNKSRTQYLKELERMKQFNQNKNK